MGTRWFGVPRHRSSMEVNVEGKCVTVHGLFLLVEDRMHRCGQESIQMYRLVLAAEMSETS